MSANYNVRFLVYKIRFLTSNIHSRKLFSELMKTSYKIYTINFLGDSVERLLKGQFGYKTNNLKLLI